MDRVGIRCFVSDQGRRPRVLLKRDSADFVVSEIGPDGQIADIPAPSGPEHDADTPAAPGGQASRAHAEDDEGAAGVSVADLTELGFSADAAEEITLMEARSLSTTVVLDRQLDKQGRTAVHAFFKQRFAHVISEFDPALQQITVKPAGGTHRRQYDAPVHLRFCLEKAGMDTVQVIDQLSRVGRGARFSFAGTKDRRAVTRQWVVVRGAGWSARRVLGLNNAGERCRRHSGGSKWFRVGNVTAVSAQLGLGDLSGNQFTIRVYLDPGQSVDPARIASLSTHGFINYFGMQRFGTHQNSTDSVGEALLRGDFGGAIGLIMSGRFDDMKRAFEQGDYQAALALAPPFLSAERAILRHLVAAPNDHVGALMAVPRESRMLYVHAWQSRIWNEAVSGRMARGMRAIAGDLVLVDGSPVQVTDPEQHSIYDIVYPLPGYSAVYPQAYPPIPADLHFRPKNSSLWDLPGAYRPLLVRPAGLACKVEATQVTVSFVLPPSSYATMALREAFDCYEP